MGRHTFSKETYASARSALTEEGKSSTARGEQQVKETGKLNPLVDPSEFGVVRPSRIRLEERKGGGFEVSVGAPQTIEYRLDTTGSMGDNVERAIRVLPQICELTTSVQPGRDPFFCASIFGDVTDRFVLCRGQFEVLADRMVDQLTLMLPEHGGGDSEEDPHYGLFGGAYLTDAYLQRIGLRSYDFTITDAPMHDRLSSKQLKRVFGNEVFEKTASNGHQISANDLPTNKEVVDDLMKRAHAFALIVGGHSVSHWSSLYGKDHVVQIPTIEYVPHVMAAIVGLTEGTLDLGSAQDFLVDGNLSKSSARNVIDAISHIPLGAQTILPNFGRMPKKGDIFLNKTDLWPVDPKDLPDSAVAGGASVPLSDDESGGWL